MKYQGSKNRHGKEILDVIKGDCDYYSYDNWVEPFVGGANMIDKVNGMVRYGYDKNEYVIELLKYVQTGGDLPDYIDELQYKFVKDNKHLHEKWLVGFVGVCCSFSCKWFGGFARNVSRANPEAETLNKTTHNYCAESKRNLLKQRENILTVDFSYSDYRDIIIPDNSIVYCDPPYAGTTKYKDDFDSKEFWGWCDKLTENGTKVYVSEYNAPENWKCIWQKEVNNTLDKDTGAKQGVEKLFSK